MLILWKYSVVPPSKVALLPDANSARLPAPLLSLVDHYWGQFFGCDCQLIRRPPLPYLLTRAAQPGLWALTCGGGWVVAPPNDACDNGRSQIADCFQPDQLPTQEQLQQLHQTGVIASPYGPAVIFLHRAPAARVLIDPAIRLLCDNDHAAVAAFATATGSLPWSLAEPDGWLQIFGYFCAEELVATCGVRLWGDLLAEIYVDTAPAHRRCGYGKAVTAAALQWIQTATPYYAESVVELTNQPSLRLMQSLGFTPYGYLVTAG
jgi:GNAT superfamily N-acetyltransferase